MSNIVFADPAKLDEAKRLLAAGMSCAEIGRQFGCDGTTVRRATDPAYLIRHREQIDRNRKLAAEGKAALNPHRPSRADFLARLAEIPPDTRSLTARLCGDPIPGDPRRVVLRRLEERG